MNRLPPVPEDELRRAALKRQLAASEADLQAMLVRAAMLRGWMVAHFRPAPSSRGWRTPVEGNAGFPDLVLARDGVVFAWELKGQGGRPTLEQTAWLGALDGGVADARVIGPAELDDALFALELGRWPTAALPSPV
jgi:hypothetical protein